MPTGDGSPLNNGIQPSTLFSHGSRCVLHERAEHEDAPEPEHDRGDRRQQLDEDRERLAHPARRELGQVDGDGHGERARRSGARRPS